MKILRPLLAVVLFFLCVVTVSMALTGYLKALCILGVTILCAYAVGAGSVFVMALIIIANMDKV